MNSEDKEIPYPDWRGGRRQAVRVLIRLVISEGALYALVFYFMTPQLQAWQWMLIAAITALVVLLGFVYGAFHLPLNRRSGDT